MRNSAARGLGEELEELPASIEDQLKALQGNETVKAEKPAPKAPEQAKPEPAATPEKKDPKPAEAAKEEPKWTLQLVSTSDSAEAARIAAKAKAKAAGFATTTVKDKGAFKVRLPKPGPKAEVDTLEAKLKGKGFKTFPVKLEP
jgi:cell division septation protein DedD